MEDITPAENTAPSEASTPTTPNVAEGKPQANAEPTEEYIVNGKPIKLTKAQAKAAVQKGLFADQRLKSASVLQEKMGKIVEALKTPEGLLGILKDPALGASPKEVFKKLMASDIIDDELKDEMGRWVYNNIVRPASLAPEELEREQKLSDYERLKQQEAKRQQEETTAKEQAQVQQVYTAIRAEVSKQIVADKYFPQTEGSVRAVIEKLRVMNKQGVQITTEAVGKAIGLVKKDHILQQQSLLDAIEDPEGLIAQIGEERALKISRALVARLQAKAKEKGKQEQVPADPQAKKEKLADRLKKKFGRNEQGYAILDI